MTDQRAFGELEVRDEQIDIAATFQIPKQILLIAQHDAIRNSRRHCSSAARGIESFGGDITLIVFTAGLGTWRHRRVRDCRASLSESRQFLRFSPLAVAARTAADLCALEHLPLERPTGERECDRVGGKLARRSSATMQDLESGP